MASPEILWAKDYIAQARARAGVKDEVCDVQAARASLGPLPLDLPEGLTELDVLDGPVKMRWVHTPDADANRRIVYLHGGGYLAGGYASHRQLVCWLAQATGACVLYVDYRLAPEARFPAALDDACEALGYAFGNAPATAKARGPLKVLVGGDSAGGGIAIATLLRRRDANEEMPAAAFSLCGLLDLDESTSKFLQGSQRARDSARMVVSQLKDLRHPQLSVVRAELSGLPPLLLQTGAEDYCQGDSITLARRAEEAGVAVTLQVWPEMFHVWQRFAPKVPEALMALQRVAQFCDAHCGAETIEKE